MIVSFLAIQDKTYSGTHFFLASYMNSFAVGFNNVLADG